MRQIASREDLEEGTQVFERDFHVVVGVSCKTSPFTHGLQ